MDQATLFGTWLRRRRRALDLTRDELARRAGCAPVTLKKIEADERRPSPELADRLALALQLAGDERAQFLRTARSGLAPGFPVTLPEAAPPPGRFAVPTPLTPLVGRRRELALAQSNLTGRQVRLLTLVGPPGVGKTRLALAVADTIYRARPGEMVFVALDGLTRTDQVAPAIAGALGLRLQPDEPPADQLRLLLHDRALLLILDNFEHLLEEAPLVARLLADSAGLRVLATSRAPLRLRGEHLLPVPPLGLPQLSGGPAGERRGALSEAERLFLQVARAVRPGFRVQDDPGAVAAICARLDGLPLAIELAAARVADSSPAQILAGLDQATELLGHSPQDLPERQGSLRTTIAWSYNLLGPDSRRLFRRCAIFDGDFDGQAPGWVADGAGEADLAQLVLAGLMEAGDGRYRMLQSLRSFGLAALAEAGDAGVARAGLVAWARDLLARAGPELGGPDQVRWFAALEHELPNLRAALAAAVAEGQAEAALRLASSLFRFWQSRGLYSEGRRWIEAGLALAGSVPVPVQAFARHILGTIAQDQGDSDYAITVQGPAVDLCRSHGDPALLADTLNNHAVSFMRLGMAEQALPLLDECLALAEPIGHLHIIGHATNNLGLIAMEQGTFATAQAWYERSLATFQAHTDWRGCAFPLNNMAEMAVLGGAPEADFLLQEALALWEALGDQWGGLYIHLHRGWLRIGQGRYEEAAHELREALAGFVAIEDRRNTLRCCEGLAALALADGAVRRATLLLAAADALRTHYRIYRPPVEGRRLDPITTAAAALAPPELRTIWIRAQAISLAELARLAGE